MSRAVSHAILMIALTLIAGCGGDGGVASPGRATTAAGSTTGTTADGAAAPTRGSGQAPAPTVRAFLSAYQAGAAGRACGLVGKGFTNPRDRALHTPASCRKSASGRNDVLAQDQQIVASDPTAPRARVVTLNAKRTQLLFELRRRGGRWRVTLVKVIGHLAEGEDPKLPTS